MKLLFMDLYCATNNVGAKNGLPLEGRGHLKKKFPKFFHINLLLVYSKNNL
jgi:hypothetical protein